MQDLTETGRELYLTLLKKVLVNVIYEDPAIPNPIFDDATHDKEARNSGADWPSVAHTMIGMIRLDNVESCLKQVIAERVPGDFIETGVWRGGTCIFARGLLKAYGIKDRKVWLADSFEGIPKVDESSHPLDLELNLHEFNEVLGVSEETVRENFRRYDLLDEQVEFLPGWFCDTLPAAPVRQLAVLRLDGDLYESTMDALVHLYPKLSVGGFVIIDDYMIPSCREAVQEFRRKEGIEGDPIKEIDEFSVYWRRSR
ncbi:TylF/MycF family methyltransferase [Amycolatopsis palatopharyngis]|uniref:TylF/MycF family methyltransferase n=1 Tax=Amycolatopsis palatopharyngis TaxID=187982 RepID=UPI001FE37337|nr:TylF/MycF family methyltransferase [Amycolatopsis palatopharyngis]